MPEFLKMTEDRFEAELTDSSLRGKAQGLAQASCMTLMRSAEYFKQGKDDLARVFREYAKDLDRESQNQSKNQEEHEREYTDKEPEIEELED